VIILKPLDVDIRHGFERLLATWWGQNWPDSNQQEIVRWRYHHRSDTHLTWVACDGEDCVAMLNSRLSLHLLDGDPVMVRETADWFCLPQYRAQLLGLRLLRKMQECGDPILVIGGSKTNRSLLTKMHWNILPPARNYILPVTLRGFAANILRIAWPPHEALARLMSPKLPYRTPRPQPRPSGASVCRAVPLRADDWSDIENTLSRGLAAQFEQEHWRWLNTMPDWFAVPRGLLFYSGSRITGVSLSQLEPAAAGLDARILHVQSAHRDESLLRWIFAQTAAALAECGAQFIRCRASTPEKSDALEAVGFQFVQEVPCFWWSRRGMPVPVTADLGYLRGDDALPLPALRGRKLAAR
jgi:hypothetical protein